METKERAEVKEIKRPRTVQMTRGQRGAETWAAMRRNTKVTLAEAPWDKDKADE